MKNTGVQTNHNKNTKPASKHHSQSPKTVPPNNRTMNKILLASGIAATVLLIALTLSTNHASPLAEYFWTLVGTSGLLVFGLTIWVVRYIWRIISDKKNRVFGSQIARRLSAVFMLVAALPALFLLFVAAQFIAHSIGSWFGNDTREALESSLNLSKNAVNSAVQQSEAQAKTVHAQLIAAQMQDLPPQTAFTTAQAKQFSQLLLMDESNGTIAAEHNPEKLPAPLLEADGSHTQNGAESLNGTLYASGYLALPEHKDRKMLLFFRQPLPKNVARDAQLIEAARAKYAELAFAQRGLQTFFLITLVVAALLAILLALAAALHFARRFVEPIVLLAEGAQAVAQGDFSGRINIKAKDELGQLTHTFNNMTAELAAAKAADEQHRIEQEAARHYLERVLASLNAGVITLDGKGCLKTHNRAAEHILSADLSVFSGSPLCIPNPKNDRERELSDIFCCMLATETAEHAVEMHYAAEHEQRILLGKAVRLPEENDNGIVLVFDNITTLVHAQKEAAWGEVAKRLAHEIRNPLTPIQLSAERLAWKLRDKLDEADALTLTKATDTIIKQVSALKEMVEEFRNYARGSVLNLTAVDLNTLIEEVLVLYESHNCTFTANLDSGSLMMHADPTAMRQVLHNLFKNAVEAAESDADPQITVSTTLCGSNIRLNVANNGKSFSKEMLQNAFDPYKTDKIGGTGLGLPVVKKIIEEHGGRIGIANRSEGGALIQAEFPRLTN